MPRPGLPKVVTVSARGPRRIADDHLQHCRQRLDQPRGRSTADTRSAAQRRAPVRSASPVSQYRYMELASIPSWHAGTHDEVMSDTSCAKLGSPAARLRRLPLLLLAVQCCVLCQRPGACGAMADCLLAR